MEIIYKEIKDFGEEQLKNLFLSVEWSLGHYPEKLVIAMRNTSTVFSAWDGDKLIGLVSAFDDSIMNAYVHYLLVNPDYQGKGIGKKLIGMVTRKYKDYLRIVLIAYEKETAFYENAGFSKAGDDKVPMFVTSLWT